VTETGQAVKVDDGGHGVVVYEVKHRQETHND